MTDTHDDTPLFKQAMHGIRKLKASNRVSTHHHPTRLKKAKAPEQDSRDWGIYTDFLDHISPSQRLHADDRLSYAKSGVPDKVLRRLRQGKLTPLKKLDLHHVRQQQALDMVDDFITINKHKNNKYLLLIHGKGYYSQDSTPVLKNLLNQWLRNHPDVVAFESAQARDGGTGAIYVMIKSL